MSSLFQIREVHAGTPIFDYTFSSTSLLGLDPRLNWKTLESEHFRVTFPEELTEIGKKATLYLEEAHTLLSPIFRWQSTYKPQVLVIDNSDSANGMSVAIGRVGMVLWVTPPESWSELAFYDDWLRLLVIHEYTHHLNMDSTNGIWAGLRYVFGDALLPNAIWPPWMIEGLAVYTETYFTKAGRGRNPYYDAVLRAAVQDDVLDNPRFVTLDKVNGNNPFFPDGEIRYQFGYHLIKEAAQETDIQKLGELSHQSSQWLPFLALAQMKKVTGKSWDDLWNEWIEKTQTRISKTIQLLKRQPISQVTLLNEKTPDTSQETLGMTTSSDQKWLAYTSVSTDRRYGLYLRDLKTGITTHVDDKRYGANMSFTPDSKSLIYSEFNQYGQFDQYSDLKVYDLESKEIYFLTHRLRARDPDISPDGKWVTFTLTRAGTTHLALAQLNRVDVGNNHRFILGTPQLIVEVPLFDRVSIPKFSRNSQKIYFSLHVNGRSQEDIMEYDLSSKRLNPLVNDGYYNRFSTIGPDGDLYFVSTRTGVENLYHYHGKDQSPTLVTHLVTALRFPHFSSSGQLYGSVLSSTGWDLVEIQWKPNGFDIPQATIPYASFSVAEQTSQSAPTTDQTLSGVSDYSVLPSLYPRAWTPLLSVDGNSFTLGAQTVGFDALDRHRYLAAGTYNFNLNTGEGYLVYSNRTLGPDLSFQADYITPAVTAYGSNYIYSRQIDFTTSIKYPFLSTYSVISPFLSVGAQRNFIYGFDPTSGAPASLLSTSSSTPRLDAGISYSNAEVSSLAIVPEAGHQTLFQSRFFMGSTPSLKLFLTHHEYYRLSKHIILSPAIRGQWSTELTPNLFTANAVLAGRQGNSILGSFGGESISQISMRGYPGLSLYSRGAATGSVDLHYPLVRLFRGKGILPFFLDNLYGFTFIETSYAAPGTQLLSGSNLSADTQSGVWLPSVGTGVRISTELFYYGYATLSLEYHKGLRQDVSRTDDLFFLADVQFSAF